jgi:hypothetical protein
MNGRQSACPSAFDILDQIVEEHNALRGHSDRADDMIEGKRFDDPLRTWG